MAPRLGRKMVDHPPVLQPTDIFTCDREAVWLST